MLLTHLINTERHNRQCHPRPAIEHHAATATSATDCCSLSNRTHRIIKRVPLLLVLLQCMSRGVARTHASDGVHQVLPHLVGALQAEQLEQAQQVVVQCQELHIQLGNGVTSSITCQSISMSQSDSR